MPTLNSLIGEKSARKLASLGLHKIAVARLRAEGHDVPAELDLRAAVQALGTNVFLKNASYKSILEGLVAYSNVTRSR